MVRRTPTDMTHVFTPSVPHRVPRHASLDRPDVHPRSTLRDGRSAILDSQINTVSLSGRCIQLGRI
jgi:hypothetical protein